MEAFEALILCGDGLQPSPNTVLRPVLLVGQWGGVGWRGLAAPPFLASRCDPCFLTQILTLRTP